jgi:hypothetical protein
MMLPLTQTCQLLLAAPTVTVDEFGNEIPSETTVRSRCYLEQTLRSERAAAGELSDTTWLLALPAGTMLRTGDAVTVDGARYEVVGDPWPVWDPWAQRQSHVEATLRQTRAPEDT